MSGRFDFERCTADEMAAHIVANGLPSGGRSLLHAMQNPCLGVFECLLKNGLNLNAMDGWQCFPIWYHAVNNKNIEILAAALKAGANISPSSRFAGRALSAAAENSVAHCKFLVNLGIDIHASSAGGWQAIHSAASRGFFPIVKYLLLHGANPNVSTYARRTPLLLYVANRSRDSRVIDILVRFGANMNAESEAGKTVLQEALCKGYSDDVFALIVNGVDVHYSNKSRTIVRPNGTTTTVDTSGFVIGSSDMLVTPHARKVALLYMSGADTDRIVPHYADPIIVQILAALRNRCAARPVVFDSKGAVSLAIGVFDKQCAEIIRRHTARIIEVCTALQTLRLPALQLCEIVQAVLWFWPRLKFHDIWNRVVAVRHFHDKRLRR